MKSYDEETEAGKADLIYGRIERIPDDAAKTAGLAKTQFNDWRQIERVENNAKSGR